MRKFANLINIKKYQRTAVGKQIQMT